MQYNAYPYWLRQVYSIKHDITSVDCLMPGLILAIRQVVRLKVNIQYPLCFKSLISLQLFCFCSYWFKYIWFCYLAESCLRFREVFVVKFLK